MPRHNWTRAQPGHRECRATHRHPPRRRRWAQRRTSPRYIQYEISPKYFPYRESTDQYFAYGDIPGIQTGIPCPGNISGIEPSLVYTRDSSHTVTLPEYFVNSNIPGIFKYRESTDQYFASGDTPGILTGILCPGNISVIQPSLVYTRNSSRTGIFNMPVHVSRLQT